MKSKSQLTIAQVIDVFENATNGAAISTQRFTNLLRKDGHKVIVISTGKEATDKIVLKEIYFPLAYIKKIMQKMKFVFAKPDKKILKETFSKVDIVHNQFPLWLGIVAVRIAKKMKKPLVSTFHVQGEQLMYNGGLKHPFWTKLTYWVFMKFIYNKSDYIICPSAFAETEIKKYGLKKPTVIISNGVTPEYQPKLVPKKYPDKFTILTVGRNATEKRQELIIRAIAASPFKKDIQLIILGDGPLRQNLEKLNNTLLDGTVEFNILPAEEIIEYYNMSNLYVHAAAIEVECMTAIEAMSCGLPLLIADAALSATKQFALNEKYLFKDQSELTERINFWFTHRDELEKSKNDYINFAKQYNIDYSYSKLIETYKRVLELHHVPFETPDNPNPESTAIQTTVS